MKRMFALVLAVLLFCTACTYTDLEWPEDGVWYCDALNMSIDFAMYPNEESVKVYAEDGTVTYYACQIDYGGTIFITDLDTLEIYLRGQMKYRAPVFYIITEDATYEFLRRTDGGMTFA